VASSRGDFRAALDGQERALGDGHWEQMPTGRFYLLSNAGYFAVVVGDFERAQWLLARAQVVAVATGLRDELVMTHVNHAWLYLAKEEWRAALQSAAVAAMTLGNDDDGGFSAEIALLAGLAAERCVPDHCVVFVSALRAAVGDEPSEWFDSWSATQASSLLERCPGGAAALSVPDLADHLSSAVRQTTAD
jgi:hypothetical protein